MSLEYIRDHYGVPARRGARIRYSGSTTGSVDGTIVGARGQYLRARLDSDGRIETLHPTWELKYLTVEEAA